MAAGRNELFNKTFTANGTISNARIVKFDSADNLVVQAAAATDLSFGISKVPQSSRQRIVQTGSTPPAVPVVTAAAGDRIDIVLLGIAEVEYGGNVTRGAKLTADAQGRAVTAAPATGVNNHIIGIAGMSGVSGDIGTVIITPSVMQG